MLIKCNTSSIVCPEKVKVYSERKKDHSDNLLIGACLLTLRGKKHLNLDPLILEMRHLGNTCMTK